MCDEDDAERLNDEYEMLTTKTATFSPEQKARTGILIDPARCEYRLGALRPAEARKDGRATSAATKVEKDPLALTQISRTSTPCSRASRTICAGA